MSMNENEIALEDQSLGRRLINHVQHSPLTVAATALFASIVGIGIYKYKHRGNMSTSLYFCQLRVIAQGSAVGCIAAGMLYQMYKNNVIGNKQK